MKKLLLTFLFTGISIISFAQTISFGLKAGINFSKMPFGSNPYNINVPDQAVTGFNAGAVVDFSFSNWSLQPGLFFTTKGKRMLMEFTYPDGSASRTSTMSFKEKLNYLELPVNLLYNIKLSPVVKLQLGGGPYLGYGLSGSEGSNTISFGKKTDNSGLKNPDYGFNFIAGFKFKDKYTLNANYGLGLANLSYDGGTANNRVISVSLGYLFR